VSKPKTYRDPRGHSLRIYDDLYDSPAFNALSPHDVMAYLALLRELKGYNNGDLSLPLSRAKRCGIGHHMTLARSLRALCAVGLVAVTRKGGATKGGQRLPTLYRVTDAECYDIPAKLLTEMKATNEWKRIESVEHGAQLIQAAEDSVKKATEKKINAGHAVTATTSRRDVIGPKIRSPRDTWNGGPRHGVTMAEKVENPLSMRVAAEFSPDAEKQSHRTPRVSPLQVAIHTGNLASTDDHGTYRRLTARPANLFKNLIH